MFRFSQIVVSHNLCTPLIWVNFYVSRLHTRTDTHTHSRSNLIFVKCVAINFAQRQQAYTHAEILSDTSRHDNNNCHSTTTQRIQRRVGIVCSTLQKSYNFSNEKCLFIYETKRNESSARRVKKKEKQRIHNFNVWFINKSFINMYLRSLLLTTWRRVTVSECVCVYSAVWFVLIRFEFILFFFLFLQFFLFSALLAV